MFKQILVKKHRVYVVNKKYVETNQIREFNLILIGWQIENQNYIAYIK